MAAIFDVKPIYEKISKEIKREAKVFKKFKLASLVIGNDYSTAVYTKAQANEAKNLGIDYLTVKIDSNATLNTCLKRIDDLNNDPGVGGIVVNKPFPAGWDEEAIFSRIAVDKDIEGLSHANLGSIFWNNAKFIPPTVLSVLEILDYSEIDLYGKDIVIIGFSALVGKPLSLILAQRLATVAITHIATYERERLPFYLENADVVISAVGKPHIILGSWIKKGAIVIDVGISQKDGKIVGDVDYESAKKRAGLITPVPGGVGKLTTLFLFRNFIKALRSKS